jgi:hypothetical protein
MTPRHVLVLLLFATSAAPGHAQERGAYVGVAFGQLDHEDRNDGRGFVFDDSATVSRILGGYRVGRNFAIEGGWAETRPLHDTARFPVVGPGTSVADVATRYELLTVELLAIKPFGKFSLFGGGGLYDSKTTTAVRGPSGNALANLHEREDGLMAAGGVGFDFGRFVLRAELEVFQKVNGTHVENSNVAFLLTF